MIEAFAAQLPVRIRFGEGTVAELRGLVGGRRALVVVEQPVAELEPVAAAIGDMPSFVKPAGEPGYELIEQAAAAVAEAQPQVLVAVGGGSAIDLAKAARLVAGQGQPFARFVAGEVEVEAPAFELVAVPTTSGTGSEVSGGSVVVDRTAGRKLGVAHPLLRAQHALVDPLLTLGLPPAMTAATGVDALAQAIGGVIVSNRNPMSIAVGLEACREIAAGLERAVADGGDREARGHMSLGSLLAGLSMNLSDTGADHALGHAIGSTLEVPHGLSVAVVLAETLEINRPACPELLERVADALGEPAGGAGDGRRAVAAVRRLLAGAGIPTLREIGVEPADVDRLVELALGDYCLTVNPRRWSEADVRAAYAAAMAVERR